MEAWALNLKDAIDHSDLTIPKVAAEAGLSKVILYRYLKGYSEPTVKNLSAISKVLGRRLEDLVRPEIVNINLEDSHKLETLHLPFTEAKNLKASVLFKKCPIYCDENQKIFLTRLSIPLDPKYYEFCDLDDQKRAALLIEGKISPDAINPLSVDQINGIKEQLRDHCIKHFGGDHIALSSDQRIKQHGQWCVVYDFYTTSKETY